MCEITGAVALAFLLGCVPRPAAPPVQPSPPAPDTSVAQPAPPEPYGFRPLRSRSNVRSEPDAESEIVATLDGGTPVGLVSLKDGWYNVVAGSVTGWVWAPLLTLNLNDRWEASISAAWSSFPDKEVFTAVFRDDRQLVIILDIAWRDMGKERKQRIVTRTGEAWQQVTGRMGITPAPEIRFMSNNNVEMARWHAFWGTTVEH